MANSEAGMSSDVARLSGGEYQVLLSFRGSDTRHGFTDFLYHGLVDAGVCVFKEDDELPIDKVIGENLLHIINNSMLYIPIFSQTYASSKRCLQELALIVENVSKSEGQKSIIPIFLDVEPEDVKLRTPLYSTAFEKHNEDFPQEAEAWRKALAEVDENKGWNVKKDQRCLIKILDNDNIWMHDQLIELGRRIVRQESPFNSGKRSRLWIAQEALEIIRTKKRKDEIQALKIFRSVDPIEITNEEFERLKNLRFLELHWGTYAGDFARCHSNLRWFSWHSPQDFRAANMYLDHLVVCKLDTIDFKDDSKAWDLIKRAQNLRVLSVTRCSSITTIPDFSRCSHLERLTLADCFNLERIESFIGDLVSLIELKIEECGGLTDLPKELGALVKLKHFSLSGCRGLRELPGSLGNLTSLTELDLSGTNIDKTLRMPLLGHAQEIPPDTSDFKSKSDKTEGGEKAIAWWMSKESCKQEMEQTEGGEKATAWRTSKESCKQEMEQTEGEEKAKAWWKSKEFFKQEMEMTKTEGGEKPTACWTSKESCKQEMEQTKGEEKATSWWTGKEYCKHEIEQTEGKEKPTEWWTSKESCKQEMEQTEGGEKATAWGTSKEPCKQKMEQEIHDELSHVTNVLDMANQPLVDEDDSYSVSGNVNRPLKRRRNDKGDREGDGGGGERASQGDRDRGSGESMGETLTSLDLPHKEEKHEMESFFIESLQGKASPESNSNQGFRAMADYYRDIHADYDDANEIEVRKKKCITQSGAAAAAVAEGSEAQALSPGVGQHRRLWVKDLSKDWWEWCNSPEFPEEEFRREFRMSKATFEFICNELDAAVTKKNTMLRDAIPVRQRVAVCVWRLGTGEPLRLVSKRFGLGISTCHKLVLEVCSAIRNVLMPKFLQWPDEGRLAAIKQEFKAVSGIPHVCGAMYTTHVPIIAPKISVAAYLNRRHTERNQKATYTITVQGVVDPRGVFMDVCIGWPGSLPDDQVLEKSALHQRAGKGLLKDVWVVGNPGHPLTDWVLVPYTHQNITWTQQAFNENLAQVRAVAREAFARLKGRWACLQKRTDVKLQDLPVVLGACCVLHNICEARNEAMEPDTRFEIFDDEVVPENPVRSAAASQARDQIAHNLLHHGLARTSFL